MRAPEFWQHDSLLPRLLSPLAALYAAATALRLSRPGWQAPIPVLCIGNAGAGGSGKTTVALDLGARLIARGRRVAFLTRGYGGRLPGPLRVDPRHHSAAETGDEALLLAATADTFLGADRAATARMAIAQGAEVLVLDDGLQNPTLAKDISLLVIDGATGFGNGQVVPSGPLREPVEAAAERCQAAVLIGDDLTGACAQLPPGLPVLHARLDPAAEMQVLKGRRVLAFAGIAMPQKFFASLEEAGAIVIGRGSFPDHHAFTQQELDYLLHQAATENATLVTTPKDSARLSREMRMRIHAAGVDLVWRDAREIDALLTRLLSG